MDRTMFNPFEEFFDESSIYFEKDPSQNMRFLKRMEKKLTEKLRFRGYLLLSEVYSALNVWTTSSKAYPDAGWQIGKTEDFVSFGIYDIHDEAKRNFINGYTAVVMLTPNCCVDLKGKTYHEHF